MKVAYTSFSSTSERLVNRIQGVQYGLRKICKDLGYEWNSSKENDIVFFEIGDLGSMCIGHKQILKSLYLIKHSKRTILIVDDYFMGIRNHYSKFLEKPFGFLFLNQETLATKKQMMLFIEDVLKKNYDIIYNQYLDKHVQKFDDISKNQFIFDYSFANDYLNLYVQNKERKVVSSSYRSENNDSRFIVCQKMPELECFKLICENRICYMKNYGKDLDYWVRNRFSQAYQANALVVGLERSIFGKSYVVSPEKALSMTDDEFEEAVNSQKEDFLKNTKSYEEVKEGLREFLNE